MDSPVFILSTGRTGTQFFEEYLNQTSENAFCLHEPRPSRRFKFLSNLYLNHRIGPRAIVRIYQWSRRGVFRKVGNRQYIESSNFMFGCIPALNLVYTEARIVHIVRHPVGYVQSHLGHGFWKGHKKFFARHVPYWMEHIEVSETSNPVALLSARWNYVNKQIASYAATNPYLFVRFEDLFSKDPDTSSEYMNKVRKFCGIEPHTAAENSSWLQRPKNYSKSKIKLLPGEVTKILRDTRSLRTEYGYTE